MIAASGQMNVGVVEWLAIDAVPRRGHPTGYLAPLVDGPHQRPHEREILVGGQPVGPAALPRGLVDDGALRRDVAAGVQPDRPVETGMRQREPELDAVVGEDLVPPVHAALTI